MHKLRANFVTLTNTDSALSFEPLLRLHLHLGLLLDLMLIFSLYWPRSVQAIAVVFCAWQPLAPNQLSFDIHVVQMVTFLFSLFILATS